MGDKRQALIYSAVSSPQNSLTLLSGRPVQLNTTSTSSGKHPATLELMNEDFVHTIPPLFVARYSFIQLEDLEQRKMTAQGSNLASLGSESDSSLTAPLRPTVSTLTKIS